MKNKTTLKSPALRAHLAVAIGWAIMMAFAPSSRAGLNGPYTNDFYTLHLWGLQDTNGTIAGIATNGVLFSDLTTNPLVNPLVVSNFPNATAGQFGLAGQPGPGATAFFQTFYGTNFGYALSVSCTTDTCYTLPQSPVGDPVPDTFPSPGLYNNGYAYTNDSCSFVNTNTGAFTWEALVQPAFSLATVPSFSPEILCSDGGNTTPAGANPFTVRANQFRLNGQKLEFNGNISALTLGGVGMIHDAFGNLPSTGPDQFVQGNWYHVAVAFTGTTPTNGDPPNVLTMYWTSFNASHTYADVLTNIPYFFTYTNTSSHTVYSLTYPSNSIIGCGVYEIGNDARNNANGWVGNISEVRISDYYRHSNEFMFNSLIVTSSPSIGPVPTNTLVGYGYNLILNPTVSGTPAPALQWYQSGVSLAGQTNASLAITNMNYALAANQWYLIATNIYGSVTSAVASVTLGATFDGLFNTGCNPSGNPVTLTAPGSVDLHWTIPQNPDNGSLNAICWSGGPPIEGGGTAGSVVPPGTVSDWIGPHENSGLVYGTFTYQTTFQVDETAVTPTNFISGTFGASAAQNGGTMQMFLNGVETDIPISGNAAESLYYFQISNGLQPGSNTLACTAFQSGGTAGNTGFNVAINNLAIGNDTGLPLATAPAINNQPSGITNVYGSTVSFQAVALGAPPLSYYWLSNGVAFTPPTWVGTAVPYLSFVATNFSTSQVVGTNYTANLQIVFSNFVGTVTSAVATVDIQLPPQTLVSAGVPIWNATNNETNIVVYFSQAVDPVTGTTLGNYSLGAGNPAVTSAILGSIPGEVILTLASPLNPANAYTLTVQNVNSALGTSLNPSPEQVAVGIYPANVALWIKANSGVTTDSTGTNVTQWNDLTANQNNFLSAGGISDPSYMTNGGFGYPVIRFTGTNETYLYALDSSSLELTNNLTVIAVMNFATLAGGTNGDIISKTANNNIPAPYDDYAQSGGVSLLRGNGTSAVVLASTNSPSTGIPHLLDVVMNGTQVTHRLDGRPSGGGTLSATITDDQQPVFIGTRQDAHNRLTGDIYELILIGQALSTNDIASMESYENSEYNLPVVTVSTNPTNILVGATNNVLYLSWPADHIGWQLQAETNPATVGIYTNWANYNPSTGTNQIVIPINLTNGTVFYRLIYMP
jgi:Concanavalin A-like lectin/glucanases superfamily/Bacterial Ig-like domain